MTAVAPRRDVATRPQPPDPRGDRFVAAGLFLLTALFIGVQLLAGEIIPPLAVPALIYVALGAAIARRGSRWLRITAVVLPLLHLLTSIPFLAEALAHPETPASFLPDAFIVIVALSVVAGAIAGLRRAATRRPIVLVAGVAALGAVAISLVAAAGVESAARQPGDVTVEAVGAEFPARVQVPTGAALWVDNQDPFRHTLVIEDTDVHVELTGSTAVRVDADLAPGTYRYFCSVPGHEAMEGELVVG